jgi:hypothetical protein
MKPIILATLLLAGCAIDDVEVDTDESELINCNEYEDCEPITTTPKPDLVPSPGIEPCRMTLLQYPTPHYSLQIKITNKGTARTNIHTARVQFYTAYQSFTTNPVYVQLPYLEPGQSVTKSVVPYNLCYSAAVGCTVMLTADYANANAESNESNNYTTWYCNKDS